MTCKLANLTRGIAVLIGVLATVSCSHDLPERTALGTIEGQVSYAGSLEGMTAPTLTVAVIATFPLTGLPHATRMYPVTDFSQPISFRLEDVTPFESYYIVALLAENGQSDLPRALGSYPDYCALQAAVGPIAVTAGQVLSGIDITLYDNAGAEDPCNALSGDICPQPGRATLSLQIHTGVAAADVGANDALGFGLFASWPPTGLPVASAIVPHDEIGPEVTIQHNGVAPGDYVLYVCFDVGGDNQQSLCGTTDVWGLFDDGGTVSLPADKIVSLAYDLTTLTGQELGVEDPAAYQCSGTGVPSAVEVTVTSSAVVPTADDLVRVSLHDAYPPTGSAAYTASASVSSFPVNVRIEDVAAGAWYVSACFDDGGDSPACDGAGDVVAWYQSGAGTVSVGFGPPARVTISLEGEEIPQLRVHVISTAITPAAGDRLAVGLYPEYPPSGLPAFYATMPVTSYPVNVDFNDVTEGTYYVAVCHDRGGDTPLCTGTGDVGTASAEPLVLMGPDASGREVTISLDLPGAIEATVTASTINPNAGDVLWLSVMPLSAAAPVAVASAPLTNFPAAVQVTDVPPGEYRFAVCFDDGGDDYFCQGNRDVLVWQPGTVTVTPGATTSLTVTMD